MKAVMKSVSPRICEKVANGDCTILVSKTAPKCKEPFKCYIYCTSAKPYLYKEANPPFELFLDSELYKGKGYDDRLFSSKVIGEFICDRIDEIYQCNSGWVKENACISKDEFFDYLGIPRGTHFGYDKKAYAWHISDLKIYDKPKTLAEFYKCGAESFEELSDTEDLCQYCSDTDYGEHKYDISSRWGMVSCEGCWCDEAYQTYLDENFALTHAPSNWCYVEEL